MTPSGSSHYEEDYTFDQVSLTENRWSEDVETYFYTTNPDGSPGPTMHQWDLHEHSDKIKITDHYEARLTIDFTAGDASPTIGGSDDGWTLTSGGGFDAQVLIGGDLNTGPDGKLAATLTDDEAELNANHHCRTREVPIRLMQTSPLRRRELRRGFPQDGS